MRGVVAFLLTILVALVSAVYVDAANSWFTSHPELHLATRCCAAGAFGGVLYCMRGLYVNTAVKKRAWDGSWAIWYCLRPFASAITGGASYVFVRAGLLVLDATRKPESPSYGFLALAFIAGLNVDRFMVKLEDLAHAAWGIRPSRASEGSDTASEG